ncbi:unnamed protein product [Fusarium equiseti]|uniref:Uncharacterized protein n=1 Tax=Fusarium equiseti TaxID=61235 RepID=A0A8J2NEI9_FUSEQ|nr:unnamed protein product [Fusarium equiseti]
MVFQDLSNNDNDPYTTQAATAFMGDLLGSSIKPTGPTVGLISKWALKLNDIIIFRACIRATCAPLGSGLPRVSDPPLIAYRKAISDELSSYLKTTSSGQEQSIDWNYWLQDLDQANNMATEFDAFCTTFKSSTEHQPLLASLKAWADPICDRKLKAKSQLTLSDQDYLVRTLKSRSADSEWVLQNFLPIAVPRFDRFLLWELLHSISQERHGTFKNSKELYRCMIEHGREQLSLCGNDIIAKPYCSNRGYGYWNPSKRFVTLLEESFMNGAGQEALGLLEQSCKGIVDERQTWSSVHPHDLRATFLEPLTRALESYRVPPVPPVQDLFEVALKDVFHRSIMPRPVQLNGWVHEKVACSMGSNCSTCRELNSVLQDPNQKEWHFPAEECWRQHLESRLSDRIYSFQTLKDRSPHTLVVTKLGTNYDKALRSWNQGVQQVEHNVSWIRRDYLRCLLGDHKYNELIMLERPSPENTVTRRQGDEHSEQPDAKRMRPS